MFLFSASLVLGMEERLGMVPATELEVCWRKVCFWETVSFPETGTSLLALLLPSFCSECQCDTWSLRLGEKGQENDRDTDPGP